MTAIKNITTTQPYLTLLPDHEVVFALSSLFLAQHLLPLISIDLSAINPAWQGKIHLLNPIEPYECYIGSDTTEFSDAFANENWFIMQLNQQNQYEWLANKRYFALENPDCEADLKPIIKKCMKITCSLNSALLKLEKSFQHHALNIKMILQQPCLTN